MPQPWWKGASVYQVYVRSFYDSDGDGQGDLPGLLARLDYIASLGVDAIWLSPIHPSPNRDWGYDVSDYEGVHPDYGTLEDFARLIAQAHARGLKILLDGVLAHTSDEHAWFAASRDGDGAKKDWPQKDWPQKDWPQKDWPQKDWPQKDWPQKDWPQKDWYVWADPKDDGTAPNNWLSVFGGPAWAYQPARRQYYHHKFLRQQPKLNWLNAAAREAVLAVLDLWLARGADGFRLDVANAYLHDAALRDNPAIAPAARGPQEWAAAANMQRHLNDANREENRVMLATVRRRVEAHAGCFVFGEFSEEFERSGCYLSPEEGLHAGYNFALLAACDAAAVRDHLKTLARFPEHWPCIAFSNHDVTRAASRFGPGSAKVLLALLMALRGTVLLYQGEELGLTEVALRRDQLRDPVGDLYYPLFKGRDGCRTPMPWDAALPNLGFSAAAPWLPLGPAHGALAVSVQEKDPAAPLHYARALLKARRAHPALRLGSLSLCEGPLAFLREAEGARIFCAFNLGQAPVAYELPAPGTDLGLGTGAAALDGRRLTLGPLAAAFYRL